MQRIIAITGDGFGRSHLACLLHDHYRSQGVNAEFIIMSSQEQLLKDLDKLKAFDGYIVLDIMRGRQLPSAIEPWQTISVTGGEDAYPGDGLNPPPESHPAPSSSSSADSNLSGEKGCQALCNGLLCAISLLAQARCPHHADATLRKRGTRPLAGRPCDNILKQESF